jgi:hypothetical protein
MMMIIIIIIIIIIKFIAPCSITDLCIIINNVKYSHNATPIVICHPLFLDQA